MATVEKKDSVMFFFLKKKTNQKMIIEILIDFLDRVAFLRKYEILKKSNNLSFGENKVKNSYGFLNGGWIFSVVFSF